MFADHHFSRSDSVQSIMFVVNEFKPDMQDDKNPLLLNDYISRRGYTDSNDDKELLERTSKYILKDFLPPIRYNSEEIQLEECDLDDEVFEYTKMLVLYNTEDSKYYIGKVGYTWYWTREEYAHKKLDPLNCPYIIRVSESIALDSAYTNILVTPKYNQFDMEVLKQYPKLVTSQLLTALRTIHKANFVHWDISTDNIVWEWEGSLPHIYLIDFDQSYEMTKHCSVLMEKFSVGYAPVDEVGEYIDGIHGYPADDMWGVGIILAELLLGQKRAFIHLPLDPPGLAVLEKIKHCDPLAVDLVTKILTEKPTDRITAKEALKHPYFDELRSDPTRGRKNKKRKRDNNSSQTDEVIKKSRK